MRNIQIEPRAQHITCYVDGTPRKESTYNLARASDLDQGEIPAHMCDTADMMYVTNALMG